MHLNFILETGLVSDELKEMINNNVKDRRYYKEHWNKIMKKMIDEVGIDRLLFLTQEFNKQMIESNKKRKERLKGYSL